MVCKGLAYGVSLSSFRGGPTFPATFIGAVGGAVMSHLPGLPLVPAVAMGMGAMTVATLRLPLASVLLATLLLGSDGLCSGPSALSDPEGTWTLMREVDELLRRRPDLGT